MQFFQICKSQWMKLIDHKRNSEKPLPGEELIQDLLVQPTLSPPWLARQTKVQRLGSKHETQIEAISVLATNSFF